MSVLFLLALCSVAMATDYDPSPNPKVVVQVGKAHFTVLTVLQNISAIQR